VEEWGFIKLFFWLDCEALMILDSWMVFSTRCDSGLEWTSSHQCTSWGWSRSSCFGDEPKTHPLPLPRDFSTLFSPPKFSRLIYFTPPPTSLTSFPIQSISRTQYNSRTWVAHSFVTQGLKKVESSTLQEQGEEKARWNAPKVFNRFKCESKLNTTEEQGVEARSLACST
jgi:hypothetical protein